MSTGQNSTLRIFEGSNNGSDWHSRGQSGYTKTEINNIQDPSEGSIKEVSSIPSPFARIHLFENAFEGVTTQANQEGIHTLDNVSTYHLLVSDAFDVAEVFFNKEIFNNPDGRIKIYKWDIYDRIENLKRNDNHRLLAETLKLFLNQDALNSNFHEAENFYLISCDNTLIGATSPSTLFFAAYNSRGQMAELGLKQGDDVFFDINPMPLYRRSTTFLRYLFGLFKIHSDLKLKMPLVWSYLETTLKALDSFNREISNQLRDSIITNREYQIADFEKEFAEAQLMGSGSFIEALPKIYHRCKKKDDVNYSSDAFALKSDRIQQKVQSNAITKVPLALQQNFSKPLPYGQGTWSPNIPVPSYVSESELARRILPGKSEAYPWVTISDFLEPYLMKLIFSMDQDYFFNGNTEGFKGPDEMRMISGDDSYLLPIKADFFKYFDHQYLQLKSRDGIPNFRMIKIGSDAVRVELRLFVNAGEYITFDRLYRTNVDPNEVENQGAIIESRFNLGFLPLAYSPTNVNNHYLHVKLVDADSVPDTIHRNYELEFYDEKGDMITITEANKGQRSNKKETSYQTTTKDYILQQKFAIVQVKNSDAQNILIPKFARPSVNPDEIFIAVDFGTTNSHISIALGRNGSVDTFEIKKDDRQLISLHDYRFKPGLISLSEVLEKEIMPFMIGKNEYSWFPSRTVITEIGKVNYSRMTPISDASIAFFMEKQAALIGAKFVTNLKWLKLENQADAPNNGRVSAFIGQLLIMIRNKVLLIGGNLDRINLVWFFPSSMGKQNVAKFDAIWNKLAQKYLSSSININSIPESFAPFYAHSTNVVKSNNYPVVNIDIGGGTTDVAVFYKDKPDFTTSFRFAGNTVFGDGYETSNEQGNGFVQKFTPMIKEWLLNHRASLYNLSTTFSQDYNRLNSADINSFFFSIEENKEVRDAELNFSYNQYLADNDEARIIFLVFSGAIIYHVAKLMFVLKLPMPRQILLSGKGANIFKLLDADQKLKNLEGLARDIFEKVYDKPYHSDGINFVMTPDPKEATCKGGIRLTQGGLELAEVDNIILIGDRQNMLSNLDHMNHPRHLVKQSDLDQRATVDSVIEEVQYFVEMLFSICNDRGHFRRFEIKAGKLNEYKRILLRDSEDNLEKGRGRRKEIIDQDEPVEESLFFYPLIGGIYELTQLLVD